VPDAVLLLVSGGPDRARLADLATASGVAEHVVFTGSVPWAELPGHYAAGDVFAMPSRTRGGGLDVEAFGLVYLEASATGLPVVAGRSGGAPETVRDGVTGHVVDGRRPAELAEVLTGLLTDHELAAKLGGAGREWAVDSWGWPAIADRLRRLLDA
jgi:phosphatidylinositol alpha-1,6-mannosyltransferase